jgi:hypothetical protein
MKARAMRLLMFVSTIGMVCATPKDRRRETCHTTNICLKKKKKKDLAARLDGISEQLVYTSHSFGLK